MYFAGIFQKNPIFQHKKFIIFYPLNIPKFWSLIVTASQDFIQSTETTINKWLIISDLNKTILELKATKWGKNIQPKIVFNFKMFVTIISRFWYLLSSIQYPTSYSFNCKCKIRKKLFNIYHFNLESTR